MGFWVGVFFSFILKIPFETVEYLLFDHDSVLNINMNDGIRAFACGCLSSGTSYILAMIVSDGGIQYETKSTKFLDKKL
jgi:hypothetical protein